MSKDLFLQMREREIMTNNFLPTKKKIHKSAQEFAKDLLDSGENNPHEIYSQALRMKEAITIIETELKKSLPDEAFEAFGLKAIFRNGGATANYDEDDVYTSIKNKLNSRKVLLDAALNSDEDFYDSDGVLVPKVSKTERKSSLSVTF